MAGGGASSNQLLTWRQHLGRLFILVLLCTLALQGVWLARVAMMRVVNPQSSSFQRSEAWRLLVEKHEVRWRQDWVDRPALGKHLPRAVLASEDSGFIDHGGVEWDAVEAAWKKNQQAQERVNRQNGKPGQTGQGDQSGQASRTSPAAGNKPLVRPIPKPAVAKVVGGSTISQQLAKNLFLSGERTALRKAQELVITLALEAMLPKDRILEIYLNQVEWGEGVFGAQAAAQHYFRTDAARLTAEQAARLAVMLPAPKRFEKSPASGYLLGRAAAVQARMGAVTLP